MQKLIENGHFAALNNYVSLSFFVSILPSLLLASKYVHVLFSPRSVSLLDSLISPSIFFLLHAAKTTMQQYVNQAQPLVPYHSHPSSKSCLPPKLNSRASYPLPFQQGRRLKKRARSYAHFSLTIVKVMSPVLFFQMLSIPWYNAMHTQN
jgi:hypothetical protein